MKFIFQNATVVSGEGRRTGDVFVDNGLISEPFEDVTAQRIDARGHLLLPGAIDGHVHFRTPGSPEKETWETGSAAAAFGGVTTVLDMPNTAPATMTVRALEAKRELIKGKSYVNYGFHFGAAANPAELEAVQGVPAFKVYMGSSTGDLLVDEPSVWEKIFRMAKAKNIPVIVHAENEARIRARMKEFRGHDEAATHANIRDCGCAVLAVEEAVALREKVGNKLHIAHLSCKEELDVVRAHRHRDLTCEVTPHHLFFSIDDMQDSFLKMNPPLRHAEDLRALWEGLRDGSVTCVATDHAPHTKEEKQRVHWDAPSGVPGVEFMLPLLLNEVQTNILSVEDVVRLTAEGPARVFALHDRGRIAPGFRADLILVDMDETRTIDEDLIRSKCGWSPYEGMTLKGWPVLTMVNGHIVVEGTSLVGSPVGEEI